MQTTCGDEAWGVIVRVLHDTTKTLMPNCAFDSLPDPDLLPRPSPPPVLDALDAPDSFSDPVLRSLLPSSPSAARLDVVVAVDREDGSPDFGPALSEVITGAPGERAGRGSFVSSAPVGPRTLLPKAILLAAAAIVALLAHAFS